MTHAEIANHCLAPAIAYFAGNPDKKAAMDECRDRIAQALADIRRQHLQAQADMLTDATPHGPQHHKNKGQAQ